ncbi:MAG TPA: hypothetical protein VG734_25625 [Lacunisphaera sp.]|nr:hypothetical protein [Lacunisphaera sp.]
MSTEQATGLLAPSGGLVLDLSVAAGKLPIGRVDFCSFRCHVHGVCLRPGKVLRLVHPGGSHVQVARCADHSDWIEAAWAAEEDRAAAEGTSR